MSEYKFNSYLRADDSANILLKDVVEEINGYLRKNKGNAADFHLIKDIVDRQLDTIDEEINHMLPVPLYLGLAATMLGIIFGLLSLDGEVASLSFVNSIGSLIDAVKYAMTCSLIGLLMTTYLSAWRYRKAKANLERQKNVLLNFIQTELLPHLNEDAVATLLNMQANLQMFNVKFEKNIEGFTGIMNDVHRSFDSQVQLVEQMKKMDMVQMSQFNKDVLIQLQSSMTEFQKFTQYLHEMNSFVSATTQLTSSVNSQLDRTNAVEKVIYTLKDNIDKNESVMDMLQSFLLKVDENKAILTATNSLDEAVKESMENMRAHVNTQVEELKKYTLSASTDLESLMQRERGQLDKLKNLEQLDSLVRSIQSMSADNKALSEALARRIQSLSHSIDGLSGESSRGLSSPLAWIIAVPVVTASILVIINMFHPFTQPQIIIPTQEHTTEQNVDTIDNVVYSHPLPAQNDEMDNNATDDMQDIDTDTYSEPEYNNYDY